MSLMLSTPPRSSVDKENRASTSAPTPRKSIEWAANKEIFTFSPASGRVLNAPNTSCEPRKSILKPFRPPLPFAQEKKRDITPLPDDALENAHFLEYPVSRIVSDGSTLRELTEAYSILAARIRASVPQNFFASPTRDTRHSLFNPLRRDAELLSKAIVRDLGRIFVDPFLPPNSPPVSPSKLEKPSLPTPQDSPTPKKGGMTEEQVKYARDLSTVASATIKFLIIAFQVPAIYNVFSNKQLSSILSAVLAIPLAESIRSPTARKICGLAVSLLQSQRLPDSILSAGAPRIVFALKRAIDGELGREGKKGATAEAFRAVHDLSIYMPGIFVPVFHVHLMTSILDGLLAPSCALRVLAAHALGGFVLGITQSAFDFDDILREVSPVVYKFFLRKESQSNSQSEILRALRTAMRTTDPTHHAQGPFWAMSVLASFIILFGPALLKDRQLLIAFRGTIDIGLKTKKRIVRAITSTLWGPLIWVWQKWRDSLDDDVNRTEEQGDDSTSSEREKVKACFSTMVRMTVHLPVGVSFVGALLGRSHTTCRRDDLLLALFDLGTSARRGGDSTQRVLDLLDRFVNSREDDDFYKRWADNFLGKLVPKSLLSVSPGLLTQEINVAVLQPTVENIVGAQPSHTDVRPLADEEKCVPGVWSRIKDAWISCIEQLEMAKNDIIPDIIVEIWTGLVRMGLTSIQNDSVSLVGYASECTAVLISIFANKAIDLRDQSNNCEPEVASLNSASAKEGDGAADDGVGSAANQRLKLMLVRTLWTATAGVLPAPSVMGAVKPMIRFLVKNQPELVPSAGHESEDEDEALSEWSQFCAQVAAVASTDITVLIWGHDWEWDTKTRSRAWRSYARGWTEDSKGSWQEASIILGLPFRKESPWDMSDADLSAWSSLLAYAVETAAKDQSTAPEVLELVVSRIEDQHIIDLSSTLRVADHLVGTLEKHIEHCSELPGGLIDLVHEILLTSYPPEPRNKIVAIWLLRSLQTAISNCPAGLVVGLLENLHDGLCTWIVDECALFSTEEYSSEIIPLFQTVLVALEPLPPSAQILQSLSTLFASALQVDLETGALVSERAEALVSFRDFWNNNCQMLEPPKGGWSEGITQALELAFPVPTESQTSEGSSLVSPGTGQPHEVIDLVSDEEDELDVLPRTTTPRRRPASQIPLPPSPSPVRIRYNTIASPKKGMKVAAGHPLLSDVPRLPALFNPSSSPSVQGITRQRVYGSRQRLRTASGSSTSSAASKDAEKENFRPQSQKDMNEIIYLGTKRALFDADSSPLQAKRLRTESCGSDDSDDARAVDEALRIDDHPAITFGRSPLGKTNMNAFYLPQTPSKRARTAAGSSSATANTPSSSPTKRRKTQSYAKPLGLVGHVDYATADDDDEYLPSSSDVESEDEDGPSGSSSPVGPFTPQATRRAQYALAITRDPASDDMFTSSSPTRNIRRMARAERLSSGLKTATATVKTNSPSTPTPAYIPSSIRG